MSPQKPIAHAISYYRNSLKSYVSYIGNRSGNPISLKKASEHSKASFY